MLRVKQTAVVFCFACLLGGVARAATETVLHNFATPPKGSNPQSGVIGDPAGNLYGTTYAGGTRNAGVVYRIDSAGLETVLYSFTGGADGGQPQASLIRDSSGNLYGTTFYGGTGNMGVVFMLNTAGQETVLYTFTGGADGARPSGPLIRDSAGNFYGTAASGGIGNAGVVYMLDVTGHETVLYSFTGGADGLAPDLGVVRDSGGQLVRDDLRGRHREGGRCLHVECGRAGDGAALVRWGRREESSRRDPRLGGEPLRNHSAAAVGGNLVWYTSWTRAAN